MAAISPDVAQYDPATHDEHTDWPVDGLNLPAGHTVQLDDTELVWKVPASQLTHVDAVAPAYWPAGQLPQLVAPVVLTNDPAPQAEHTDAKVAPTTVE